MAFSERTIDLTSESDDELEITGSSTLYFFLTTHGVSPPCPEDPVFSLTCLCQLSEMIVTPQEANFIFSED